MSNTVNHEALIDELNRLIKQGNITKASIAKLMELEYITLAKYLSKERNIRNDKTAKKMVVIVRILRELIDNGSLPVPTEVNARHRTTVALDTISSHIRQRG